MLTTGYFITAEKALTLGLINKIVKDNNNLDNETNIYAEKILSKLGVAYAKSAFYKQLEMPIEE